VLDQLGITTSNAINIFFKQVVLHQGLPFAVKLPTPIDISKLTPAEVETELMKGYEDYLNNRVKSQAMVTDELNQIYDK